MYLFTVVDRLLPNFFMGMKILLAQIYLVFVQATWLILNFTFTRRLLFFFKMIWYNISHMNMIGFLMCFVNLSLLFVYWINLIYFASRMLDKNPANRPSASEVLRNDYVAENLAVCCLPLLYKLDISNLCFTYLLISGEREQHFDYNLNLSMDEWKHTRGSIEWICHNQWQIYADQQKIS